MSQSIGVDDIAVLMAKAGRIRIHECLKHLNVQPNTNIFLYDIANVYAEKFHSLFDSHEWYKLFSCRDISDVILIHFVNEVLIVKPHHNNPVLTVVGNDLTSSRPTGKTFLLSSSVSNDDEEEEKIVLSTKREFQTSSPPRFLSPPVIKSDPSPSPVMNPHRPIVQKGRFTTRVVYPPMPKVIDANEFKFEETHMFSRHKPEVDSHARNQYVSGLKWPPRDGSAIMAAPKMKKKKKLKKAKKTKKTSDQSESGIQSANSVDLPDSSDILAIPDYIRNHQSTPSLVPELKTPGIDGYNTDRLVEQTILGVMQNQEDFDSSTKKRTVRRVTKSGGGSGVQKIFSPPTLSSSADLDSLVTSDVELTRSSDENGPPLLNKPLKSLFLGVPPPRPPSSASCRSYQSSTFYSSPTKSKTVSFVSASKKSNLFTSKEERVTLSKPTTFCNVSPALNYVTPKTSPSVNKSPLKPLTPKRFTSCQNWNPPTRFTAFVSNSPKANEPSPTTPSGFP